MGQLTIGLLDSHFSLNEFERNTFGFGDHHLHPDQLQDHHAGEERKDVSRGKSGDHFWEERCEHRGEDPVSEASERLSFGAMTVREYLGDEYPDDCALAHGM